MEEEEIKEAIDWLVSEGALYQEGVDDFGDIVYRFNMDVLKIIMPELYLIIMEELDEGLMDLYKMGLVNISYDENLKASFSVSDKGKHYIKTGELLEDEFEED